MKDEKRKSPTEKKNPYTREAWVRRKKERNAKKRPNPMMFSSGYFSVSDIAAIFQVPPELISSIQSIKEEACKLQTSPRPPAK